MKPGGIGNPLIAANDWSEPLPLLEVAGREPYPVEALPPLLRDAVVEVQGYVQAPLPLVACSALSALSVAGQGLADVARDDVLRGPVSLYLLALAESGERKTACDNLFTAPIRQWEREEAERLGPLVEAAAARREAWAAERSGKLKAIEAAGKKGSDTNELKRALQGMGTMPPALPVPVLFVSDWTSEALGYVLAREWPSTGVIESEGGLATGGHAFKPDNAAKAFGMLNRLWDGGSYRVTRRTSESFTVRGRLTVSIMVQPATLRDLVERTGELVRGTGWAARFLWCDPESTQGERLYREPAADMPALAALGRALCGLLDTPLPLDNGTLRPHLLTLAPAAKAFWVKAHDAVERELRSEGDFATVRDVASKAMDNAVRLAALFHLAAHGPLGEVGPDDLERGVLIALWHLCEARRLLGGLARPKALLDAEKLEEGLIERGGCWRANDVLQRGPTALRAAEARDAAVKVLASRGRARWAEGGDGAMIVLNPALLKAA